MAVSFFVFFVVVIVLKDYRKVLTFVLMQNIILIAFKTQQNHKKLINKSADSCNWSLDFIFRLQ